MSPQRYASDSSAAVRASVSRIWFAFGVRIRDTRIAKRWTVHMLAEKAGLRRSVVYGVEAGQPASPETAVRLASALGLRLEWDLIDARERAHRTDPPGRPADLVHSAMGEFEATHLRRLGFGLGIDEPYQHYQFAGRADVVAWNLDRAALLHLENKTRFPDLQELAGAYNAKRAYLGAAIAARLGISRWMIETHAIVALWSAEVLHAVRMRPESFRAL